jgi:hypothetical protein
MRLVHAALLFAVSATPAFAQREPEFVIPGKLGVPVYINGIDASWAVVEGEFGLDRPGAATPTVIFSPLVVPIPYAPYAARGYYPADGRRPGYGRLEVVPPPNRIRPPPAPSFFRSWSSQSAPGPVTDYAPFDVPPVVIAPRYQHRRAGAHGRNPGHGAPGPNIPGPNIADPGIADPNNAFHKGL